MPHSGVGGGQRHRARRGHWHATAPGPHDADVHGHRRAVQDATPAGNNASNDAKARDSAIPRYSQNRRKLTSKLTVSVSYFSMQTLLDIAGRQEDVLSGQSPYYGARLLR